jgi:hypothetical protein
MSTLLRELRVFLVQLVADDQRVRDAVDVLRDRALLRACRLLHLLLERPDRLEDLVCRDRDLLELARRQLPVGPDRCVANELTDLLRVFGRDLLREVLEDSRDERARFLERREACSSAQLFRPRVQKSSSSSKPFSAPLRK